jgi:hypothetical protein
MANRYRNAFLDLTTANTTIYTTPSDCRSIIQNVQVANDLTANVNVDIYVHDSSVTTDFVIGHDKFRSKRNSQLGQRAVDP